MEPNTLSYSGAVSACEKASGSLWHIALDLSMESDRDVVSHSATRQVGTQRSLQDHTFYSLISVAFAWKWDEMGGTGTCFSCSLEAVQASISACEKAAKWTIALELLLLMPLLRIFANLVPQIQGTFTGEFAKLWLDSVCLRMS